MADVAEPQTEPQTAEGVSTPGDEVKETSIEESSATLSAEETPESTTLSAEETPESDTAAGEGVAPVEEEPAAASKKTTEPTTTSNNKNGGAPAPVVSSSKRSRPPYKYNPDKITLRFLFASRDGLTVTVECNPGDTVGEVKGALLSVWPEDLPKCAGGDYVRLICMGKGILSPDTKSLEDCQVPVFKTHPTPINVSVRPEHAGVEPYKGGHGGGARGSHSSGGGSGMNSNEANQGCACIIL